MVVPSLLSVHNGLVLQSGYASPCYIKHIEEDNPWERSKREWKDFQLCRFLAITIIDDKQVKHHVNKYSTDKSQNREFSPYATSKEYEHTECALCQTRLTRTGQSRQMICRSSWFGNLSLVRIEWAATWSDVAQLKLSSKHKWPKSIEKGSIWRWERTELCLISQIYRARASSLSRVVTRNAIKKKKFAAKIIFWGELGQSHPINSASY